MKICDLFAKLFVTRRYFTIALRQRREKSILVDTAFLPQHIVPATPECWCADPILVEDEDRTWLFYEAVRNDHGHIEAAQVLPDCTLSKPMVVLQDNCHYSYPFVFRHENIWYMIPESSASNQLRLYRAQHFPDQWELVTVLLREKAVDTTVFEQNGQLYLLTYLPDTATERVSPRAYTLALREDGAALSPIPWANYDELMVRGAGPVFSEEDARYRPAQISREQHYGDGLAFYRIENLEGYEEAPVCHMGPEQLKIRGIYADGLHTYCRSGRFEAIDIRCGTVDYFKPIKKLLRIQS